MPKKCSINPKGMDMHMIDKRRVEYFSFLKYRVYVHPKLRIRIQGVDDGF